MVSEVQPPPQPRGVIKRALEEFYARDCELWWPERGNYAEEIEELLPPHVTEEIRNTVAKQKIMRYGWRLALVCLFLLVLSLFY